MYIVTDLTRFSPGNPNVCTALLEVESGRCVRPMPYLTYNVMRKHGILPGALLSGSFRSTKSAVAPHVEDCDFSGLKYHGAASKQQFREVLAASLKQSVAQGFGVPLAVGQKVIGREAACNCSIITIRVPPARISVHPDSYNNEKIKASFTDGDNQQFRYMPITDLGFYDYAKNHRNDGAIEVINEHWSSADEVYLRVGLSRFYEAPDARKGYWIQINGIYTFPGRLDIARGYE